MGTKVFPNEPVPPVMRIDEFFNIRCLIEFKVNEKIL